MLASGVLAEVCRIKNRAY